MSSNLRPFHLAFPVTDLLEAKKWYTEVIGCSIGRESEDWVAFNMFGHQVVAHSIDRCSSVDANLVDGENVPIRHFGVILNLSHWKTLKENLENKEIEFLIKPYTRFKGLKGEQRTMFIKDPSGNVLEFKAFKNDKMIFEF